MATDARIALAGKVTDVGRELAAGQQTGERFRTAGVREQILDQTAQQGARTEAFQSAQTTSSLLTGLKSLPLDQRASVMAQQMPMLQQMGLTPEDILTQDLSNTGLDQTINGLRPFTQRPQGESFTLAKGAQRFDTAGNLIAENIPEETAADGGGFTNIKTDPATGVTTGLNKGSGQIEVIPASPGAETVLEEQAAANLSAAAEKKVIEEQSVTFTQTGTLRKEFEANTKEALATIEAFGGMQSILTADEQVIADFAANFEALADEEVNLEAILNDSRAISDIALIFSFFKTVDPTSTVREGEFATVENAGSLWTRWGNTFNKLLKGERMNDNQRNQIIRISQNKRNAAAKQLNKQREKFGSLASRQQLDPSLVITGQPVEENVDFTSVTRLPSASPDADPIVAGTISAIEQHLLEFEANN